MYALVDCNNFYCSCERVFNPKLNGKPMIVLSNNDGCAISRSEEAKALGIAMASPAYMMESLLKKNNVAVFSSNYTLYGDMSARVMKILEQFVPRMEIYSIDEAFLDMHRLVQQDLLQLSVTIKKTVQMHTGIPVTLGVAATKTLAKMANRYAKKKTKEGIFWAANPQLTKEMLGATPVTGIWGIGKQHGMFLHNAGIHTAADFIRTPEDWVRTNLSVVGLRLLYELRGIPTIGWEEEPKPKKNICTSRSFGILLTKKEDLREALVNYAAACAAKLRAQKTCCKTINVFIHTNPHKTEEKQYQRSINLSLVRPSNHSAEIIRNAVRGLDIIFKEGYRYMKCGVIVSDFVPEGTIQSSMLEENDQTRDKTIMQTMDKVNKLLGKETVRMASQGFEKRWRLKSEHLSPRYTTRFDQLLEIRI
jgi:DNA polymerase V